ncbi:hypothetical protein JCM10212_000967 [Sporobolomyces blumeae]
MASSSLSTASSSTAVPNRSTTSTPTSQPLAASTSRPGAPRPAFETRGSSGRDASFDFLFSPQVAHESPDPTQPNGLAPKVDKGKGVALDEPRQAARSNAASQEDDLERQRRVDKVLKRAEAAKLARAFRNRLALASYKTTRGWQDVNLDEIEPHLREEAMRRQQAPPDAPLAGGSGPSHSPSFSPQHVGGEPSRQSASPAPDRYQYQIKYDSPRANDMASVLASTRGTSGSPAPMPPGSAHKRSRSIVEPGVPLPYAPSGASPYSTANVYRAAATKRPESPSELRASKRRNVDGTTPRQRQKSNSPSKRATPLRQSTNGTPEHPVSSADPNFSSFVGAAAALKDMARVPSDPSLSGSGSDEDGTFLGSAAAGPLPGQGSPFGVQMPAQLGPANGSSTLVPSIPHPPHHHHAFPEPLSRSQGASFSPHHAAANGQMFPAGAVQPRPSTPDKGKGVNGQGGSRDESEVAAADLMLFLAHFPSPVQSPRKSQPTLGDGAGIKGRRLFSGPGGFGEDDEADELNASTASNGRGSDGVKGGDPSLSDSVFGEALNPLSTSAVGPSPGLARSTSTPFITSSTPSASRQLAAPFDLSANPTPPSNGPSTLAMSMDPSKPSSASHFPSSLSSAAPIGLDSAAFLSDAHTPFSNPHDQNAPATPRQRQPSLNGQSWESFINASPSPVRSSVPRGETPPGLGSSSATVV